MNIERLQKLADWLLELKPNSSEYIDKYTLWTYNDLTELAIIFPEYFSHNDDLDQLVCKGDVCHSSEIESCVQKFFELNNQQYAELFYMNVTKEWSDIVLTYADSSVELGLELQKFIDIQPIYNPYQLSLFNNN
jgi:hypothetical protein